MLTKILGTLALATWLAAQPTDPVLECTPESAALCEVLVDMDESREAWLYGNSDTLRYNCQKVVAEAKFVGVYPPIALSIARFESSFNPNAKSSAGCLGLMQVQPYHHCPNRSPYGCDVLNAGMNVALQYMFQYGPIEGLSAYRAGPSNRKNRRSLAKAGERIQFAENLVSRAYGICYNTLNLSSPYIQRSTLSYD